MDCCKYGEYRVAAHAQYGAGAGAGAGVSVGAGAGWDGYGYAPLPYAPYAHGYYAPPAHDPYARYYRYDYPPHHVHHADHAMPMDYGAYALKEARTRRILARREQRPLPAAPHLPLPRTPPLECGLSGRGPTYCESQVWPHYQMGVIGGSGGGWNGANTANGWASRGSCSREPIRYNSDCRLMKAPLPNLQACAQDARATQFPVFDESSYGAENSVSNKHANINDYPTREAVLSETNAQSLRESFFEPRVPRPTPPEEKRPPVVPLPAFQQAFGSTEIGKFAEAFSRAEAVHDAEDSSNDNFVYDSFQDWDGPPDPQWSTQPVPREIKCEDNY